MNNDKNKARFANILKKFGNVFFACMANLIKQVGYYVSILINFREVLLMI